MDTERECRDHVLRGIEKQMQDTNFTLNRILDRLSASETKLDKIQADIDKIRPVFEGGATAAELETIKLELEQNRQKLAAATVPPASS